MADVSPPASVVWVRRLLATGSIAAATGAVVCTAYLLLRPPCRNGYVRLIDLTPFVIGVLILALLVQAIAWWRWRRTPTGGLSTLLAVLGLLALPPTLLLLAIGISTALRVIGLDHDPACWTF